MHTNLLVKRWHVFLGCFPLSSGIHGLGCPVTVAVHSGSGSGQNNDGGRKAVREYIVINDELREIFPECHMQSGGITLMP